jgi:cytidylate kinase
MAYLVKAPFVLAIGGRTGSGKTLLCEALARALALSCASFGDLVRSVATARGLDHSRGTLQAVGASLIDQGWEPFCQRVLADADWQTGKSLVVEGIRHAEALHHIRRLVVPARVVFVFLTIGDEVRSDRLSQRGSETQEQAIEIERHSTESQVVAGLRDHADLVLDGESPLDALADSVMCHLADVGLLAACPSKERDCQLRLHEAGEDH